MRHRQPGTERGFTLVEILVSLVLLSVLATLVFPVINQQIERGNSGRVAEEMAALRTAVALFHANVGVCPGDVEDLVNAITAADESAEEQPYSGGHRSRWIGPYLKRDLEEADVATGDAYETGFNGVIQNQFVRYNSALNSPAGAGDPWDVLAVKIEGLTGREFLLVNYAVDGQETNNIAQGRLRFKPAAVFDPFSVPGETYFLVNPCQTVR